MQWVFSNVLRNQFWAIGALTVVVCATFAAQAVGHYVEADVLGDSSTSSQVVAPLTNPSSSTPMRDKNGQPLESRNMWCSTCSPGEPSAASVATTTSLPLSLLATNIGATESNSTATVVNSESQKQGAYSIGDVLPGASGPIVAIRSKYIAFEHAGHTERLVLIGQTLSTSDLPTPPPVDSADELANGIKKVNETSFEIAKDVIDKVLADPMAFAKGIRATPSSKGLKLYAVRPSSVVAKLGLSNGDTLASINGMELTTIDKALEAYSKLRGATSLEMEVVRRGKPVTLTYSIR